VQTGVYRTGEFLASNVYDIAPDVITLAKGLGGGVPIGAIMSTHKTILQAGEHGSTFGGNYLSSSAANAVLSVLEPLYDDDTLEHTQAYFKAHLENIEKEYPSIFTQSVGVGMMLGLRVCDGETLSAIVKKSFENGLLVLKAGRNTLRFLPPLTISDEEIDTGMKKLRTALASL